MAVNFCGQALSAKQISLIGEVAASCRGVSRTELAYTVCELLDWRRANGRLKSRECWALLEQLEAAGELRLPVRRATKPKGARTAVPHSARGEEPGGTLCAPLRELTPLTLTRVETPEQHRLWRELVGRYHYQGHAVPFGAQLRYLLGISRPQPQVVGCLQFSSPAWRLAARDRWIGWDDAQRARALQRIVNNSRFLVLPWVQVRHLASAVLARAARRLVEDWQAAYAVRPLLLETLVDAARFAGTCYRAANWLELGSTRGRGRMDRTHQPHAKAPKTVFVYPLAEDVRRRLQQADDARPVHPRPARGRA
jgi:Druantia protein DruA